MGEDGFATDAREMPVVVVPAPGPVGEPDQVLVHAPAPRREVLIEVHAIGAVGLQYQEIAVDDARQVARCRTVLGLHDPIDDERAKERQRRAAAAHDGVVVEAHAVVHDKGEQRHDRRNRECSRALHSCSPGRRGHKRGKDEEQEDLAHRADDDEQGDGAAESCRPADARALEEPNEQEGEQGEARREQHVRRQAMEEQVVARVEQEHRCRRDAYPGPELASRSEPSSNGQGV